MDHASAAFNIAVMVESWDAFVAASAARWRHVEAEGRYTGTGYRREQPCLDADEHHRLLCAEGDAWAAYRQAGGA